MIYLLEDDVSIRELVSYALNNAGNETCGFEQPSELYSAMLSVTPELIILDMMLPEEDGISVLKKIRAEKACSEVPVIMLTAKDSEYDKVRALEEGADDYITKPFGIMELLARVKAVLRRYSVKDKTGKSSYEIGGIVLSVEKHRVTVDGEIVELTLKEFDLLRDLMEHRGAVRNRDSLLSEVWGYDFDGENRTVDVHIRTLRAKLGERGDVIETVRGVGYKID